MCAQIRLTTLIKTRTFHIKYHRVLKKLSSDANYRLLIVVGIAEPMMISSPIRGHRKNSVTYSITSLLDIVPTILDWFNITYKNQSPNLNGEAPLQLTGKSLLPLLREGIHTHVHIDSSMRCYLLARPCCAIIDVPFLEPIENDTAIFASQTHHEITMYYPMRAIRTKRYKLIHNINYRMPFPIDQDFYVSPTFQVI